MHKNRPPKQRAQGLGRSEVKRLFWLAAVAIALAVVLAGLVVWLMLRGDTESSPRQSSQTQTNTPETPPGGTPQLSTDVVVDGREHVWDIAFLPSGELLFTERKGRLNVLKDGSASLVADISDVRARGEGGLMGLTIDPEFNQNRYIYTCFNSTEGDVRVVRWRINGNLDSLEDRTDIITGMPANTSGRHSGCRMGFGLDGYLWVGTGDSASDGAIPQDPKSLGGKILRVDRDGQAAEGGNLSGEFDPRIYSYGHRNTQGLAFFEQPRDGVPGVSTEHGPSVDDEVNLLLPGNFGWDPVPGYNESVPMTDKQKFPDAVEAIWSSGEPTLAPSGATFLYGEQWRGWSGALVMAMLKDQRLMLLFLGSDLQVTGEQELFVQEFGRLRTVAQGPDGNLYFGTTNGENDKIIRVTPQ